jgi:hypothetical protein
LGDSEEFCFWNNDEEGWQAHKVQGPAATVGFREASLTRMAWSKGSKDYFDLIAGPFV